MAFQNGGVELGMGTAQGVGAGVIRGHGGMAIITRGGIGPAEVVVVVVGWWLATKAEGLSGDD